MTTLQRARNFGSNYTTFRYAGQSIAYLQMISDDGQQPITGHEFVHPLGYRYPVEIVTSRALDGGLMRLSITELWHQEVWQQMQGLAGAEDIIAVFEALAAQQNYVTCTKIITPPDGRKYGKTYHNCVIIDVPDGEEFNIGTLTAPKTVTIAYTHTTKLA